MSEIRTIYYSNVEAEVARRLRWDPRFLSDDEFEAIRDGISNALGEVWTFAEWPGIIQVEKILYAREWDDAATYSASAVVFHEPSGKYFQALVSDLTAEPTTWSGTEWVRADEWADWMPLDGSAREWSVATAYVAGDRVFYSPTGATYQCHTASTGDLPTDQTKWGALVEYRTEAPLAAAGREEIGHVVSVTPQDPTLETPGTEVLHQIRGDKIRFVNCRLPWVWVKYFPPTPILDGQLWDPTKSYGAPIETTEDDTMQGYEGYDQLRAVTTYKERQVAIVFWGFEEGDGAGGGFRWNPTSTAADNCTLTGLKTVCRPSNNPFPAPGCWERYE